MAQKRTGGPYIWITTLAKLLTGENSCEWAGWFKAHHQSWKKPPTDFDSTKWMLEHTALVNRERESFENIGYEVHTENQNLFRLKGATATIAGKPDLIGEKTNEILISDAKTGNPQPLSPGPGPDLPVRHSQSRSQGSKTSRPGARSDTRTATSAARRSSVTPDFVANLASLIRRLAADVPARRVPSVQECRYCEITKADCPDRMEDNWAPEGSTDDF